MNALSRAQSSGGLQTRERYATTNPRRSRISAAPLRAAPHPGKHATLCCKRHSAAFEFVDVADHADFLVIGELTSAGRWLGT
jgi:hypothetical protein